MKKLIPAIIAILIIPFAIACKKGTSSTGTVTNGVAKIVLTISPALVLVANTTRCDAMTLSIGTNYSTDLFCGTSTYTSDNFSVTEGQNFGYELSTSAMISQCYSVTGDIYYNGVVVSSKSVSIGYNGLGTATPTPCTNGTRFYHNAIVK